MPSVELRKLCCEFAGTFVLTTAAAGADIVEFLTGGQVGHVARYLVPGIAVMAMIWSMSGVSGAHLNPAVTFAFVLRGQFRAARLPGYVCAQLFGAIAAAFLLRGIFGAAIEHGMTKPGPPFSVTQAVIMEAVLSFVLVLTILGTVDQKAVVGKNAALAVGGVVALCGLGFSPVSGASMNPARSFGPMLAAQQFTDWWVYLAGPLAGAAIATLLAFLLYGNPKPDRAAEGGGQ